MAVTGLESIWRMPSTRSRTGTRRSRLKWRFDPATSATKEASGGSRTTSNERSRKRWRPRSGAGSGEKRSIQTHMAKSAAAAESAAQSLIAGGNGTTAQRHTNSIHLSLQGKGGVGKSLIASILAQYFRDRGREIRCIDTDPVNSTMFQYKALDVSRLELLRDGSIDQRG